MVSSVWPARRRIHGIAATRAGWPERRRRSAGAARTLADAEAGPRRILFQQALSALKAADTSTFFAVLPDTIYTALLITLT